MDIIKSFVRFNRGCSRKIAEKFPSFFDEKSYKEEIINRIYADIEKNNVKKILEVGGVDRPLLTKGGCYQYDGLDIDSKDLCQKLYDKFFVQSIEQEISEKYDSIISFTLFEHVANNKTSFENIYLSLNQGGTTHHYIPSKWHLYAIALRMVGPNIQKKLIPILRPGAEHVSGYPAFFNYCSIPSMKNLFLEIGFNNINIKGYYRANDYFSFFVPLFLLVTAFENVCRVLHWEIMASGFIVSASKEETK